MSDVHSLLMSAILRNPAKGALAGKEKSCSAPTKIVIKPAIIFYHFDDKILS